MSGLVHNYSRQTEVHNTKKLFSLSDISIKNSIGRELLRTDALVLLYEARFCFVSDAKYF